MLELIFNNLIIPSDLWNLFIKLPKQTKHESINDGKSRLANSNICIGTSCKNYRLGLVEFKSRFQILLNLFSNDQGRPIVWAGESIMEEQGE